MPVWTPAIDPANPLAGCHPERYALKRLDPDGACFLGLNPGDQTLLEVSLVREAYHFLTHEAALRAAGELNRMGRGPLDVIKVEDPTDLEDPTEMECDGIEPTPTDSIGSNQQQPDHETPAPT
ncbi:MAG: hypothetical protein ACK56I_21200, partial [bacterium]